MVSLALLVAQNTLRIYLWNQRAACSHVMKPTSTALPTALRSGGERGVMSATVTLGWSEDDWNGSIVSDCLEVLRHVGWGLFCIHPWLQCSLDGRLGTQHVALLQATTCYSR